MLAFADSWDGPRPMLIHCLAGVSRSTAAAFVIVCARSERGEEMDWARRLRRAVPTATPNPMIIAPADSQLNATAP